jgi:hypothetical protein
MLTDESVSRFHAAFLRTLQGVWVVDLIAREGVFVNGVKIRWGWLEDGDTVRIGRFTFIMRYETPPAPLSRRDIPLEAGASLLGPVGQESGRDPNRKGRALAIRSKAQSAPALPVPGRKRPSPSLVAFPNEPPAWQPALQLPPEQIAMWRQQMQIMESFHNDMVLMVQMFAAMHREHLVSVRDELDKVKQLTRELRILQKSLTQAQDSTAAPAAPGKLASGKPVSKSSEPAQQKQKRHQSKSNDQAHVMSRPNQPNHKKAHESPASTRQSDASHPPPTSAMDSKEGRDGRLTAVDPYELHSVLTKRITELQQDRRGYWQKILGVISK